MGDPGLLPEAEAVEILSPDGATVLGAMARRHEAGFFVGSLRADDRPFYRLRIKTPHGETLRYDPYSFGPILSGDDLRQIRDVGSDAHYRLLGAHQVDVGGIQGFRFTVWAPTARRVSVSATSTAGTAASTRCACATMPACGSCSFPQLPPGLRYKFEMAGPDGRLLPQKADPVAFASERPPATASVLHASSGFRWRDEEWISQRAGQDMRKAPMSIYECHLGSWARVPEEGNRYLTYRELAERLIPYVKELGFSHIELLPITEFPFDGSWGYQPVALRPDEPVRDPGRISRDFVDAAHEAGIGLSSTRVPGHFPDDDMGSRYFDGTHLY